MPQSLNLQPLLDTQLSQLNLVFSDGDSIDTKALTLLGANLAILLFIAQSSIHFRLWIEELEFIAPFLISLALDGFATWPRKYRGAIDIEQHVEYLSLEEESLVLQLLADTNAAIKNNSRINRQRWYFCSCSFIVSALGLIALFVII